MKGLPPGHACACATVAQTRADRVRQAAAAPDEDLGLRCEAAHDEDRQMKSQSPGRGRPPLQGSNCEPRSGDLVLFLFVFVLIELFVLLVERINVDTLEDVRLEWRVLGGEVDVLY